jgi:hypothetical protein
MMMRWRQVLQLMVLHLLMARLAPACTIWRCTRLLPYMHYWQRATTSILLLLPLLLLLPHFCGSWAKVWVAAGGGWLV